MGNYFIALNENPSLSTIIPLSLTSRLALAGILLAAVLIRLYGIDRPLLDEHMFREGHSAMMARNYVERSVNIFEPEVDGGGPERFLWLNEFPLYEYLVSILYRIFGVHEILGRLISVVSALGACWLIFEIGRRWQGVITGLSAALIFTFAPLSIYQGRAFQRQMLAIFLLLLCVDAFERWVQNAKWFHYGICAIAGLLALLINIPTAYVGLPLAYIAWRRWGWSFLKRLEIWLLAILLLAPSIAWYSYATETSTAFSLEALDRKDFRNFGDWRYYLLWLDERFFASIWQQVNYGLLTWAGVIFTLFGLVLLPRGRGRLPHAWLLAVLIYFILDVYPIMVQVHDYYFLNLLPPLALFGGFGIAWLWERPGRAAYAIKPAVVILIVLMAWMGWTHARPWFGEKRPDRPDLPATKPGYQHWLAAAKCMANKDVCPPDALIVVDSDQPPLLYYCHRRGWGIIMENLTPQTLDNLRAQGAGYLLLTRPEVEMQKPELAKYLAERCTLLAYVPQDGYIVYRLVDPAAS